MGMVHLARFRMAIHHAEETIPLAFGAPALCFSRGHLVLNIQQTFYFLNRYVTLLSIVAMWVFSSLHFVQHYAYGIVNLVPAG